jgi:hypothetical protein
MTDRMEAGKICSFYNDPVKQIRDAEALRVADYRRSVTVETGLRWRLHRRRVALQAQVRFLGQRFQGSVGWHQHGAYPVARGHDLGVVAVESGLASRPEATGSASVP